MLHRSVVAAADGDEAASRPTHPLGELTRLLYRHPLITFGVKQEKRHLERIDRRLELIRFHLRGYGTTAEGAIRLLGCRGAA